MPLARTPNKVMPDAVQPRLPPRSARERITTSCSECRRRKQKCSQGHPCANCARRFPQPVCEYKTSRRRHPPGVSNHPTFTVTLLSPEEKESGAKEAPRDAPQAGWSKGHETRRNGLEHGGEVAIWSGVNMATQYPSAVSLGRLVNPHDSRLSPPLKLEDVTLCEEDCEKHPQAVHDAVRLIVYRVSIPDKFLFPLNATASAADVHQLVTYHTTGGTVPRAWKGVTDGLESLPMVPSLQNRDLLKIFLKLLSRYKTSLDGNPDPDNPIVKLYFPFCIQDPLLLQIILYTSACFLHETGHMTKMGVIGHKGKAIRMLNENLRSQEHQTGDSVIAGVVQLIVDEWYWGENDDLRAHMRGLREMIRIRGGFMNLGMDGLLAKMVISHDVGIAVAHEIRPFLGNGPDFDYEDRTVTPFRISHNTPFVNDLVSFAASAEALDLHPITASILDDVRFLINAVICLPANPSAADLERIATTSDWIYARISRLPDDSPDARLADDSNLRFPANTINAYGAAVPVDETYRVSAAEDVLTPTSGTSSEARSDMDGSEQAGFQDAQNGGTVTSSSRHYTPPPHQEAAARVDAMYRVIRMAALVNVRAIRDRRPLSEACTRGEFLQIWTTAWRVPLTTWRGAVGIFNWAMVCIVPSSHGGAHERFARTMFMISMVSRAVEDWRLFIAASRATMRLQAWLAGGWGMGEGVVKGGGAAVERHGFLNTGWT